MQCKMAKGGCISASNCLPVYSGNVNKCASTNVYAAGPAPFACPSPPPVRQDLAGVRHAARQLGVEHAPVVVDFEWFGAGRCAPCLNGILVHARDEAAVRCGGGDAQCMR